MALPDASMQGVRTRRKNGDLILTGRGGYLEDVELPGMLHAVVLRSTEAHADILEITTTAARAAPGVRLVMTGPELAEYLPRTVPLFDPAELGGQEVPLPALAVDRVVYEGQPVAVIVAEGRAEAEAARELIQVRYSALEPVLDAEQALEPDSPLVFPGWKSNALIDLPFTVGDADAVFAEAPHVIEGQLRIQRYQTSPMETRGYIASWEQDGRLHFYAPTQNPHPLRTQLAAMLRVSELDVRVIMTRLGGGFGSKIPGSPEEGMIAWVSRLLGAPVKWVESREECLLVGARQYSHEFAAAYDGTGRILAIRDRVLGDVGAVGGTAGWGMCFVGGLTFPGPYKIENYDVHVVPVATNKPPWNAARGFGKESATLVMERMIELIAASLGLDSSVVRFRNFIPADEFPYWVGIKRLDSGDYAAAMTELLELADYDGKRHARDRARHDGRLIGLGLAFELCPEGSDIPGAMLRGYDTSTVRISPSGTVTVVTGVTSPGTGNETGIAQVVATELGIEVDQVNVLAGDTDVAPYGFGNFSSRGLTVGGNSALLAARELRERLAAAAGALLGAASEELDFIDGRIRAAGGEGLLFRELLDQIYKFGFAIPGVDTLNLEATCTWGPAGNLVYQPDELGRTSLYPSFPYSAHFAEVEVDPVTAVVDVIDYAVVHDCGVVINPNFVEGQLQGSIAMGIGGALWEELRYDDKGHLAARTLKHYLLPRAPDLPTIRMGHQCTPSPYTPLGTKGAGESGVAGAVAVIANAVNDALSPLGVTVHEMPLSPPRLLAALEQAS